MGIACGLARQTSNRSSGKCRVSCTRRIRYFILFHYGLLIRHFSLTFLPSPLPPRGLSFSPFVSPISNDGNALPLSLSFSVFYFVWPSKSTANHRAFVVCSQRTKGIKFLKMLIGRVAVSLYRWTMILGRTLMETIFFHRSNLCSRIRSKNHQSSSIVIERKKSIR